MKFRDVTEKYNINGCDHNFYDEAENFSPSGTFPEKHLVRAWFLHVNRWLKLEREPLEAVIAAAEKVAADRRLAELCEYCRFVMFERGCTPESLAMMGCPQPSCPDDLINDFFGLIIHLSGLEILRGRYAERNIPESVMVDTCQTVRIWIDAHKATFGRWGFAKAVKGNPRMHYINALRLMRLGRLEFERNYFTGGVVGLKNRRSGDVRAVLEGGTQLRRDGLVNGTNDIIDPHAIVCKYVETGRDIHAHPACPRGLGLLEPERFDLQEWSVVLRRGYQCLNMHIPRDGKMNIEACLASLETAREFFPSYFPGDDVCAFTCHTWLFDEQYRDLLTRESNIVRFGELFNLFPEKSSDRGIYAGVFDEKTVDIPNFTPRTSLERAIVSHYKKGGRMHQAGGFILF